MNNLGGYKEIELIFIDELYQCVPVSGKMYVQKKTTIKRILPIIKKGITLEATAQTTDAGTLWTHGALIPLPRKIDLFLELDLEQSDVRPCILIAETHNNERKVFGSENYPLYGNIQDIPGSKPSDLCYQQLTLQCISTHKELLLIE